MSQIQNVDSAPDYIMKFIHENMEDLCMIYDEGLSNNPGLEKGIIVFQCSEKENKMDVQFMNDEMMYEILDKESVMNLKNNIQENPIVALVLEGTHAIEIVRKMVGSTEPRSAIPGTIRSDFASVESYPNANTQGRAVRNLIHASDSVDNAKKEIKTWFDEEEVHDYKRPGDEKIFG